MESQTVEDSILEALREAHVLESARDAYDESHMLFVAQILSGAPYSFVEHVHVKIGGIAA